MTETAITAALVDALGELEQPRTDEKANTGQYAYAYLSLPGLISHVKPVLKAHGLAFMQNVSTYDGWVQVETIVLHTSGEDMRFGPLSFPLGQNPQQSGSAITYARRYALAAALGIAPEEDDDGAATLRKASGRNAGTDGGVGGEALGEGVPSSAPTGGPRDYLTADERTALIKALGGQVKAIHLAQERYGERIRSMKDVTRDMALELVAGQVGQTEMGGS